jgi:hypothetical protein
MREKKFEDMVSIDARIRQAILDDNKGRSPDNFIESAEGGGLDADLLAGESPTEEQALIRALDERLAAIDPHAHAFDEDGKLRYD